MLTSLKIHFFRNFEKIVVENFEKTNLIVGANGAGKTNFIEALSILSTARPLRKVHYRDLIAWNAHYFYLKARYSDLDVEFGFDGKRKHLKLNGDPFPLSRLESKNPSVAFLPSDLNILAGSPAIRRGFLNTALSKTDSTYKQILMSYNRVLKQRNAQLKLNPARVNIWNAELIKLGSLLSTKRRKLCNLLSDTLGEVFGILYTDMPPVRLIYRSTIGINPVEDFTRALEREKKREIYAKHTLVGPHRDDFEIMIDEKSSNIFASQGQNRALVLALKLSVAKLIENSYHIRPILLIDDALLELDEKRRALLMEQLFDHYQMIITLTSKKVLPDYPSATKSFKIYQGKII